MLSNAYFLAKIRFDTAKNEPAKICKNLKFANFPNFANPTPSAEVAQRPSPPPGVVAGIGPSSGGPPAYPASPDASPQVGVYVRVHLWLNAQND